MPEVESVEVEKPEEKQYKEKCSQLLDEVNSIRGGFDIMILLKRNVFIILTMAAVGVGKKSPDFLGFHEF